VHTALEPTLTWRSTLSASTVAAAVLPLATMTTLELWRYSAHLSDQEQASQQHRIRFWRKALYPLSCLVMVALALPFAYLHARAGGVSLKVFGGILIGIGFVLLNNLSATSACCATGRPGSPPPARALCSWPFRWPPLHGWSATVEITQVRR
jgi:lipopolysaccharide export system permease protein